MPTLVVVQATACPHTPITVQAYNDLGQHVRAGRAQRQGAKAGGQRGLAGTILDARLWSVEGAGTRVALGVEWRRERQSQRGEAEWVRRRLPYYLLSSIVYT